MRVLQVGRGRERTLQKCLAMIDRTAHASDRRTPRPWTFFVVAAGLLTRRSLLLPRLPNAKPHQ